MNWDKILLFGFFWVSYFDVVFILVAFYALQSYRINQKLIMSEWSIAVIAGAVATILSPIPFVG